MPRKDPEERRKYQNDWRRKTIRAGYGKVLYARRKHVYNDAERFREALKQIAGFHNHAGEIAWAVLKESKIEEDRLPKWPN